MSKSRYITLPEAEAQKQLKTKTRRGFLVGGAALLAGVGGYRWVTKSALEDEVPWPQRKVLNFNGNLAARYVSDDHLIKTFPVDQATMPKSNGHEGMDDDNIQGWKLNVDAGGGVAPFALQVADVQSLPKVDLVTRLCCIEGWSTVVHWGGVRFSDFTKKYFPGGKKLPAYVYMATPDEEYYVGLDMKSALHPQTLLAWEMNGKPLELSHGAPLRLVIPVKYGIKNIKRIGTIRFTDQRPGDYWAEEGYDWFAGL
jgi:DMSO/TMAO reductase YedYZ molybdopterin-dependent catalytic subunit